MVFNRRDPEGCWYVLCSSILAIIHNLYSRLWPLHACTTRGLHVYLKIALGFYSYSRITRWEWFTSLNFDWKYVSGNKKFRWPMVSSYENAHSMNPYPFSYQTFYFLNRYCLLFALVGMSVAASSFCIFFCGDKNIVPFPSMWQRRYTRHLIFYPGLISFLSVINCQVLYTYIQVIYHLSPNHTATDTQCRSLGMLQLVWLASTFRCGREWPVWLIG